MFPRLRFLAYLLQRLCGTSSCPVDAPFWLLAPLESLSTPFYHSFLLPTAFTSLPITLARCRCGALRTLQVATTRTCKPLYTAACCYKPQLHPTRCCALYIASLRSQALLIAPNRSSSPLIAPTPLYKLYTVSGTPITLYIAPHRPNTPNSPPQCPKSHPTRLSLVSLSSHRPTTLSVLGMRRLGS